MSQKYIVLKFGGSSQCPDGMKVILGKLLEYVEFDYKVALVISAVGKTTNNLYGITNFEPKKYQIIYECHKNLCESIGVDFLCVKPLLDDLKIIMEKYISQPFIDITQEKLRIVSFGEYLASTIVHNYLQLNGVENSYLNAHLFMKNRSSSDTIDSDSLHIRGEFYCDISILSKLITKNKVFVTQGFISSTSDNKCCVLTRSGSNTTASLIAASLKADRLEIWTDVSGVYTANPREVKTAVIIPYIEYAVCQEAAAMGSQLIHPYSIKPCEEHNIPIHIKNTFYSNDVGTIICRNEKILAKQCAKDHIYLIAVQKNVTVFRVKSLDMWEGYGFVQDIFSVFSKEKIDVNIITTSQFSITTTTSEKSIKKLERVKNELGKKYEVDVVHDCAIVSIVGDNININKSIHGIHELVSSNTHEPLYIIHFGSNNMSLSYVVNDDYAIALSELLHAKLIEAE